MASSNPSDRNAASSINELERAHQTLGRTQEQAGRADPGQSASSPTTPSFAPRVPSGMDSLNAYIQTTDRQRGILNEDSQFVAFQQANPWARTISDSLTIAAVESDFEIMRQRRLQLRNEVAQALARAGNTDPPIQLRPTRLDPEAAEFRPRQLSLSQGGHLRQSRPGSPSGGHGRQSSQSSPLGPPGRQVSGGSPVGVPGRQVSGGGRAGEHGRSPSQGGQ